jgi:hypothetical protein
MFLVALICISYQHLLKNCLFLPKYGLLWSKNSKLDDEKTQQLIMQLSNPYSILGMTIVNNALFMVATELGESLPRFSLIAGVN